MFCTLSYICYWSESDTNVYKKIYISFLDVTFPGLEQYFPITGYPVLYNAMKFGVN